MTKKKHSNLTWQILTAVILVFLFIFLIYPLFNIGWKSFFDSEGNFTLANYWDFVSLKYYRSSIINSFVVSTLSTVFAVLIGVPIAYIMSRHHIPGKKFLNVLIVLSMLSPPFIGAYSWIILFGRSGVVTSFLSTIGINIGSIYGFKGMVLVFAVTNFPLVYLYVSGAINSIDASLEEAAENLGMSKLRRITTVTLPVILPTITTAMLMAFMSAFADFGTPMLIGEGYKVLPVLVYQQYLSEIGGNANMASTLSMIVIICASLVLLLQQYVINKRNYTMNLMRKVEVEKLSKGKEILASVLCYLVIFIGILPQVTVFITSFIKTSGPIFVNEFSLDSYRNIINKLGSSVINTFVYSLLAMVFIVILGMLIAYLSVRKRSKINRLLDVTVMFPYIIPGSVLGIALLLTFNDYPIYLTGSWMIMVLAYIIRRLPYTVRSSSAILYQIDSSIEEASINLGVSPIKTFFKITAVLMLPGVFSGAIMSWIKTINELSASIMLYTTKTSTIAVSVYTEVLRGNFGSAAALSVVLSIASMISVLLFNKFSGKDGISL